MFGLGSGIFASSILKLLGENNRLIIYEPSKAMFIQGLHTYDWTPFLRDHRVKIAVEGINEIEFMDYLQGYIRLGNLDQVQVMIHPYFDKIFPESCWKFCHIYEDARETLITNQNTDKRFGKVKVDNILHNLNYLKQGYSIREIEKVLDREIPVIIVSAGPSLQKNVDVLKKAKGKAVIIGVDSALPTLYEHNVEPDFFISIDPIKSINCFQDERLWSIPFICNCCTNPEVMDKHKGIKLYCKDDKFIQMVYQTLGVPPLQYNLGGSVATAAFAVCAELNRKVVILVGQDLAYSDDRKSHAGSYNEEFIQNSKYLVDGVEGNLVQSRGDWYTYLQWFRGAVHYCENMTVIDASEGGAKIDGTVIMKLQDAISHFCVKNVDTSDLFHNSTSLFGPNGEEKFERLYEELKDQAKKIRRYVKRGEELIDAWKKEILEKQTITPKARKITQLVFKNNDSIISFLLFHFMDICMIIYKPEEMKYYSDQPKIMEELVTIYDLENLYKSMEISVNYIAKRLP